MSNNTKIYSEAIAEAKSIRETAMANAKLALEEAFAPRMQEMMSNKLEALAEEMEESELEEYGDEHAMSTKGALGDEDEMDEISLEELIAELDSLEEATEVDEAMNENTLEEAEDEDAVGEITVDELKDIIRSVMNDVMETEEESGEEEGEEEAGEEEEAPEGDDELNLDEILAELDSLNENEEVLDENMVSQVMDILPIGNSAAEALLGALGAAGVVGTAAVMSKINDLAKAGIFGKKVQAGAGSLEKVGSAAAGARNVSEGEDEMEEGLADKFDKWITNTGNKMSKAGQNSKVVQSLEKGVNKAQTAVVDKGYSSGAKYESLELEEALKTISVLRSSLNEVNLLNAKLLYVNKLFKGRNLTEAQKVKVINAFDRAETVKETKNIFETLKESFTTTKNPIKESLSFASKAAGVAPNRQPIVESDDFMKRMQKIAGII